MGCGASKKVEPIGNDVPPKPESDVDVASVREFDVEQKEAEALHVSPEPSVHTPSHHSEEPQEPGVEDEPVPPPPADNISLQSIQGELPPLAPPRRSKDHLLLLHHPHPDVFRHTDHLVQHTPSSATSSVTSLAFYLTSSCPSDLHCVRAIFCWLAQNITYDSESYLSGSYPPQDSGYVLRCRKAICLGFALFCEVLCNLADIPCVTVQGIAKGFSHNPQTVYSPDSRPNHAWNLVLVQGEWRPLDCAWGAGWLHEDGTFRRELDDHWFLTDPAEFLPTHFPYMYRDIGASRVYQLVKSPIDLATFSSMVRLDSLAYRLGLQPVTHPRGVIRDVRRDVIVRLRVGKGRLKAVTAYLREKGERSPRKDRSGVLTSWEDDDTCRIYVRPPLATTYTLTVMGLEEENQDTTLQRLCVYTIICASPHPDPSPFPDIQGHWGLQYPVATECGLKKVKDTTFQFEAKDGEATATLALCRHTEVAVKLRHAERMDEELARHAMVEYRRGESGELEAVVRVRVPLSGYYALRAFACHPDLPGLTHVGDYLIHSGEDSGASRCPSFPVASDFAHVHCTRLLHPLARELPRCSGGGVSCLFRVLAPSLKRMRVNGRQMARAGGEEGEGLWEAEVTLAAEELGRSGTVVVSGAAEKETTRLCELYRFDVV